MDTSEDVFLYWLSGSPPAPPGEWFALDEKEDAANG